MDGGVESKSRRTVVLTEIATSTCDNDLDRQTDKLSAKWSTRAC